MNSTEGKKTKIIQEFYNKQLMPLAEKLDVKNKPLMPLGAEPAARTYYISRRQTSMTRQDFEAPSVSNARELEEAMHNLWVKFRPSELAGLAKPMAKMSQQLAQTEEQTEEVSPFIYVMF
jgi:hypothetical protein